MLLHSLLRRLVVASEADPTGKAVSVRVAEPSTSSEAVALEAGVCALEAGGVVRAVRARASAFASGPGRTTTLTLLDPDAARRHLGMSSPAAELAAAMAETEAMGLPAALLPERNSALAAWAAGGRWRGATLRGRADALVVLRAAGALLAHAQAGAETVSTRSLSARAMGDSKALKPLLEAAYSLLAGVGLAPDGMTGADYARSIGIEPMPSPVLVAGPLLCGAIPLPALPWIGVPPSTAGLLSAGDATSLLTVENLATFARRAEESRPPGEAMVWTGGWPSASVLRAIRALSAGMDPARCLHWGDVDPAGVAIGLHLHRHGGAPFRPYALMSPTLATRLGQPAARLLSSHGAAGTPWQELGDYLASTGACTLEQEVVDGMGEAGFQDI